MLYLEDYLEMIEHLPQELRDRFTEIREMDLQVQNSMDSLEERTRQLFANARKMKPDQRDAEFEKIRQDYYKSLEDADEKVHMANQVYDLVDRYLRRLDQELQKFKMELEADNAGITEVLEKRSLELDNPPPSINHNHQPKAEKRKYVSSVTSYNIANGSEKRLATSTPTPAAIVNEKVLGSMTTEAVQDTLKTPNTTSAHQSATSSPFSSNHGSPLPPTTQPSLAYSLGHMGAGNNAIAAAASQAIAATQQMQQGRRSASLKASFQVVNSGIPQINKEFILGREVASTSPATASAAAAAVAATVGTGSGTGSVMSSAPLPVPAASAPVVPEPKPGRQKKQSKLQHMLIQPEPSPSPEDYSEAAMLDEGQNVDWTYDPNEPRYCICNQVSYGDMVACDNGDCPVEWFHYNCVGITQPPRGKWFCPQCTAAMRRRGRKSEK